MHMSMHTSRHEQGPGSLALYHNTHPSFALAACPPPPVTRYPFLILFPFRVLLCEPTRTFFSVFHTHSCSVPSNFKSKMSRVGQNHTYIYRVGQTHIYTVCTQYLLHGFWHTHIRYTLSQPTPRMTLHPATQPGQHSEQRPPLMLPLIPPTREVIAYTTDRVYHLCKE